MHKLLALLLCCLAAACAGGEQNFTVFGETMGTSWRLQIPLGTDGEVAYRVVQAEVDHIEELMSPWKPESDLSRFAGLSPGEALRVAPETLAVLAIARETWAATDGAFDPTIGAVVEASGFGVAVEPASLAQRERSRSAVGFDAVVIDAQAETLMKLREGVRLDLSAVAKGYSVDRAAEALEAAGFDDFLLEVGGEIVCHGGSGTAVRWIVGIEAPTLLSEVLVRLALTDLAVATSGDYRNVRELDGNSKSHLFDPETGESISGSLSSVTVIAEDCATADAYATAAMVMGIEAAAAWIESVDGVEAVFVSQGVEGAWVEHWTSGARAYEAE